MNIFPRDSEAIHRHEVNETIRELIKLIDDPFFKVIYRRSLNRNGYEFHFEDFSTRGGYPVCFYVFCQKKSILGAAKGDDCQSAREITGTTDRYYFYIKVPHELKFDEHSGLNSELAFTLAQKCCRRFNITLANALDSHFVADYGESPLPNLTPAEIDPTLIPKWKEIASSIIAKKIARDQEFLTRFEEKFNTSSVGVLQEFGPLLDKYDITQVLEGIQSVWDLMKTPEDEMYLKLDLIHYYVKEFLEVSSTSMLPYKEQDQRADFMLNKLKNYSIE